MRRSWTLALVVLLVANMALVLVGCQASSPSPGSVATALEVTGWETHPTGQAGAHFGAAASWAGDVDGDGFAEVIASAPGFGGGVGRAYLLRGSATGLAVDPSWGDSRMSAPGQFGAAVAGVGDVNGDKFADVVVGAPGANEVFLYLGNKDGLAAMPSATLTPGGAEAGAAVAAAGDVNGDGFGDVLVGAPGTDGGAGHAYLYLGDRDTGLAAAPAWDVAGTLGARFGAALAGAGDVNGDGFGDVIVGSPGAPGEKPGTGRVDVFLGSATGLATTASWTKEHTAGDGFGAAVAGAGDVNADGFADLLVGQPGYDSAGMITDDGEALLFLGSVEGPVMNATWHVYGGASGATMGQSLAGLGDVNGDGYADVAVASHVQVGSGGTPPKGEVRVYFGTKDGLAKDPWTMTGDETAEGEGMVVQSAGDVTGDGFADLLVGSPQWFSATATGEGRVRVFRGGAAGLATASAWSYEGTPPEKPALGAAVALGDVDDDGFADALVGAPQWTEPLDATNLHEGRALLFRGSAAALSMGPAVALDPTDQVGARFGTALALVGDVDGDGFADAAVGAAGWSDGMNKEGRVYLYRGQPGGLSAVATSLLDPTDAPSASFGASVAAAGDVNGDGLADVVVGAPELSGTAGSKEGAVYLYLGKVGGLVEPPQQLGPSGRAETQLGYAVAGAGDVDGDGFADVLVGQVGYDGDAVGEGKAYLYRGSPTGLVTEPAWQSDSENAQFGAALAGVGDVNGDGYADVVIAAPGFDVLSDYQAGAVYLFHGGPTGLEETASWHYEGTGGGRWFGFAVAAAGDVNGDGFSDFAVGAPYLSGGRVYLFFGGPDEPLLGWSTVALGLNRNLGWALAGAADLNGDGFSDLLVGEPMLVGGDSVGSARLFLGGDGTPGAPRGLVQLAGDNAQRVPLGAALHGGGLVVRGRVTEEGPVGGRLRLEVEVKGAGMPFDGESTVPSGSVKAGELVSVTVGGLAAGAYRWRARVVYPAGSGHGRWVSYGGNPEGELDFRVLPGENGSACGEPPMCTSTFCSGGVCCAKDCAMGEVCDPRGTRCQGEDERPDAGVGPQDGDGGSTSDGDGGVGVNDGGRRSYYDCRIGRARSGDARWLLAAVSLLVAVRARRRAG